MFHCELHVYMPLFIPKRLLNCWYDCNFRLVFFWLDTQQQSLFLISSFVAFRREGRGFEYYDQERASPLGSLLLIAARFLKKWVTLLFHWQKCTRRQTSGVNVSVTVLKLHHQPYTIGYRLGCAGEISPEIQAWTIISTLLVRAIRANNPFGLPIWVAVTR